MNYFIERFAAAYRAEMAAFVAMLETGAAPLAGIRDGLEAQRIAEAAIVAMQTGQPVTLTPDWRPKLKGGTHDRARRLSLTACASLSARSPGPTTCSRISAPTSRSRPASATRPPSATSASSSAASSRATPPCSARSSRSHGLDLASGWWSGELAERGVDAEIAAVARHAGLLRDLGCKAMVYGEVAMMTPGAPLDAPMSRRRHDAMPKKSPATPRG